MFSQRYRFGWTRAVAWVALTVFIVLIGGNLSVGGTLPFGAFDQSSSQVSIFSISEDEERSIFKSIEPSNNLTDLSVRTQLRVTQGSAGVLVRWNSRQPAPNGYFGLIGADGTARLGWAGGDWTVLRETAIGLDTAGGDIVLQLEAVGNHIDLWTWPEGEPMPEKPTLSITDDAVASGTVALGGWSTKFPHRGPIDAIFRYVQIAVVPEPSTVALSAIASAAMFLGNGRPVQSGKTSPPNQRDGGT